jgi:hypothetical protein
MRQREAEWEQIGERKGLRHSVEGKEDEAIRRHELGKHLAACAARRAGFVAQIGDCNSDESDLRAMLGNSPSHSGTLRTNAETVRCVFHVRCADDLSALQQDGRADSKTGVGRVRLMRGLSGGGAQLCLLRRRDRDGRGRHLVRGYWADGLLATAAQ